MNKSYQACNNIILNLHFGNPKYSFRVLRPSLLVAQSSFSFLAYPMKSGLQLSFLGNHLWMQYNMKIAFKNNFSGAIPTVDCSPDILTPSLLVRSNKIQPLNSFRPKNYNTGALTKGCGTALCYSEIFLHLLDLLVCNTFHQILPSAKLQIFYCSSLEISRVGRREFFLSTRFISILI